MQFQKIEGDIDFKKVQHTFAGRLTPRRVRLINSYARKNSERQERCGHEYDCCGCLVSVWCSADFKQIGNGKYSVTITKTFNYNY